MKICKKNVIKSHYLASLEAKGKITWPKKKKKSGKLSGGSNFLPTLEDNPRGDRDFMVEHSTVKK